MKLRILLLAIFALPIYVEASTNEQSAKLGKVIHSSALHALPKNDSQVITNLKPEQSVNVFERKRAWYQVLSDAKQSGWIKMLNVRFLSGPKRTGELGVKNLFDSVVTKKVKPTASTGIRGFDEQDLKKAKANIKQLKLLASYQTTTSSANTFAKKANLTPDSSIALIKDDGGSE
ncbi:SH3 domain-containing protein [Thalassotalea sp. M1531]|uniref:SH3 domain-containing protein n=1 Tax=Thalassotalea algicola TaxID=2716224 RepID=A0A7Y0LH97_9GAMM|nr:SH3 domain-containing protein [Thalassotalea algicola]NMP33235.1 SH3 domain-containing protein [Thalassotalea algicola]